MKKQQKITNAQGFTLIELLVVVLIIGILAAVALPQYQLAVQKSRYATIKSMVQTLAQAEEIYFWANGTYTKNFTDLDVDLPITTSCTANTICKFHNFGCELAMGSTSKSVVCYIYQNNVISMAYVQRLNHSSEAKARICRAYSQNLKAPDSKVCKQETRKDTLSKYSGYYYATYP